MAPSAGAAETTVRIDLGAETRQQHRIREGTVFLELTSLKPGATYSLAGTPDIVVPAVPTTADPAADICSSPSNHIWGLLKAASISEGDVMPMLDAARRNSARCTHDQKSAAATAANSVLATLTRAIALPGTTTPPLDMKIERKTAAGVADKTWQIYLVLGPAADPDLLNDIEKRMDADERATVIECSYAHSRCESDALFVNADHVSAIVFRGVPTQKALLVVADPMSEPYEQCEVLRQNSIAWEKDDTPDVVVVTLHMFRQPFGFGAANRNRRRSAALRLYGWTELPRLTTPQIESLCTTGTLQDAANLENGKTISPTTPSLFSTPTKVQTDTSARRYSRLKPAELRRVQLRSAGGQIEEITELPIVADGTSEHVKVTFYAEGEEPKTFVIPFYYQRFWADAGGAFLFPRIENERVVSQVIAGKTVVQKIERRGEIQPETGIVVNLHPGNYPEAALQFGLATGGESEISYYLGPAIRLREIGKRGLATFSFGGVLSQTQRYPDLRVSTADVTTHYEPNDVRLLGVRDYKFNWYFGISLGFTFGGVAAGADAVKEMPGAN